jgi:hypothetical protein
MNKYFFRPYRDWAPYIVVDPALKRWAIVIESVCDCFYA